MTLFLQRRRAVFRATALAVCLTGVAGCVTLLSPYQQMADKKLGAAAEALLDLQAKAELDPGPLTNTPELQARGEELRTGIRVARNMYRTSYGDQLSEGHRVLLVSTIDNCDNAVRHFFEVLATQGSISDPAADQMLTLAHTTCLTAAERVRDGK
ncbi:hypothetical protein [Brevundimonas sp. FT23028]|uniref:hypothetical protein n=1 Tax=Brevundimonas sp. FT23028 TaxID=3393748 RepID=UPI003B586347